MKVLGIIPARKGSKGVPNKNMKLLAGKPLLSYTMQIASQSTLLHSVIISTDSDEMMQLAKTYNISAPFKRPDELATDTTPTIEVIIHALNYYEQNQTSFDAVCLLQPTYPFREMGFIDKCIEKFIATGTDTLISILPVPHQFNPHWVFFQNNEGSLVNAMHNDNIITRRQQLPPAYIRDGSVYIIKTDTILQRHSLFGNKVEGILSNPELYINIDTVKDFETAQLLAGRYSHIISQSNL